VRSGMRSKRVMSGKVCHSISTRTPTSPARNPRYRRRRSARHCSNDRRRPVPVRWTSAGALSWWCWLHPADPYWPIARTSCWWWCRGRVELSLCYQAVYHAPTSNASGRSRSHNAPSLHNHHAILQHIPFRRHLNILLLVLLARCTRSRLLQLTRYINYFFTFSLTSYEILRSFYALLKTWESSCYRPQ